MNYQRLAAAGGLVAGPGGVPLGVYPEGMSAYLSGIAADQPPFYANPVSQAPNMQTPARDRPRARARARLNGLFISHAS